MDEDGTRLRGFDLSTDEEVDSEHYVSSDEETEETAGVSLPQPAAICRERKLPKNPSAQPQSRRCSEKTLKKLSNSVRLTEFPNEYLERRDGKLFCEACRQWMSEKKSVLAAHITTDKHVKGKAERAKEQQRQLSFTESLKARDMECRLVGETLPLDHRSFRAEVVQAFLHEGIPLAKIQGLRQLLEKNNFSLCSTSHMAEYIPMILAEEKSRIKKLIRGVPLSIIFDGTTRLGEAIAIVVRVIDGWTIRQVLVRLHTVAKPVNGQDLTRILNHCLSNEYQVDGEFVVAAMRDGAAVNNAAIRNLKAIFANLFDVTCFSHAANNAGRRFEFPILKDFGQLWVQLFSSSCKAKLAWKQRTSSAIKMCSNTRWWSLWEVLNQVLEYFGDVKPFLETLDGVCRETVAQLRAIVNDEDDYETLRLQLAAMIDVGKHLVRLTYNLEGDGPLIFSAYTILQAATTAFSQGNWPILDAMCRSIAENDPTVNERQLREDTLAGARPAINWFLRKFNVDFGATVSAFRLARYFDPVEAQGLAITAQKVEALRVFPFLDSNDTIHQLQAEVPAYLAAIDGVDLETDDEKIQWWSRQQRIPEWVAAVRKLMLIQPSSAASERAFSLLAACFTAEQNSALEDAIEASVMLRYNHQ